MLHSFDMENCPPQLLQRHPSTSHEEDDATPLADPAVGVPSKVGSVYLLAPGPGKQRRTRVVLKVYYTNFGRYVVVSQDKALCKDCGYINLRNCIVKKTNSKSVSPAPVGRQRVAKSPTSSPPQSPLSDVDSVPHHNLPTAPAFHSFEVIPRDGEGQALMMAVADEEELEQWMNVLGPQEDSCRSPQSMEAPFRCSSPMEIINRRPVALSSGPGMSSSPPRRHGSLTKRPSSSLPALEEEGSEE